MENPRKRRAALKPAVVEISSESEQEVEEVPAKQRKTRKDSSASNKTKVSRTKRTTKNDTVSSSKEKPDKSTRARVGTKRYAQRTNSQQPSDDDEDEDTNRTLSNRFPGVQSNQTRRTNGSEWRVALLSQLLDIDLETSTNIIKLFEDECTVPFICRYRRDMIPQGTTPERLRQIKSTYNNVVQLRKKIDSTLAHLEKENILTNELRSAFLSVQSMEELDFLYGPYKPASKGTLADRAIKFGLDKPAHRILFGGSPQVRLEEFINIQHVELDTMDKVHEWICHLLSHAFSKSTEVLSELRRLQQKERIVLKCKDIKNIEQQGDAHKYSHYFNFENDVKYIKPHQTLAILRGEKAKVLSVKIIVPDTVKYQLKRFVEKTFLSQGVHYALRTSIFEKAFEECYSKKLQPYINRQIRSNLTEKAKLASLEVFSSNLKQLLLISPLKGKKILGIDPGFKGGCKLALISETADVLETGVIYPLLKRTGEPEKSEIALYEILKRHKCSTIALGNGTGCRDTEVWLADLYKRKVLDKDEVRYSIVSEQGASIYSCSEVAKEEFPDLDVNLISAVSIARRLNDPLSEYVKIDPQHLGVGMYQHDVNEKLLADLLNEVVMECVSFVGVDINTAGIPLLKHIAGLTTARAEKITEYRLQNGPLKSRSDLLKIKNIGPKTFTQCAGFIRIDSKSIGSKVKNLLDCTWVHPESYDLAKKILRVCKLNLENIGQEEFINTIKLYSNCANLDNLEVEWQTPKERIKTVLDALQRELFQDYRSDINKKPLFKQGICHMTDLKKGCVLTGAVNNITHFGAFVDIGVGRCGLIHTSKMNGVVLNLGDIVEVSVLDVDVARGRIQLQLENTCISI